VSDQTLVVCDACGVRIALNSRQLEGTTRSKSGVYEFDCPRCEAPNQLWWTTPELIKAEDVPLDSDRYFSEEVRAARLEEAREREENQRRSEEARREGAEKRAQRQNEADEARRLKHEEARARNASSSSDSDDYYDDDDSGRTSNDDRSDSMNPNNDAYGASRQ
jgi:hypothetical protein